MSGRLENYLNLLNKYLAEADDMLAKEDFTQASEKMWGAAAEAVKAVAAARGVELLSHRDLWEFTTKLDKEHPEMNLLNLFHIANSLHTNFYENWLTPEALKKGSEAVHEFVEKLRKVTSR